MALASRPGRRTGSQSRSRWTPSRLVALAKLVKVAVVFLGYIVQLCVVLFRLASLFVFGSA